MSTDRISDMLTRIRNAQKVRHLTTLVLASQEKERILEVLAQEGYIERFEHVQDAAGKPALKVYLRYTDQGAPAMREISRMSRPGRRMYVGKEGIPRNHGGLGTVLISTSQGVLTDREARKRGVGGELLCSIF